MIRSEVRAGPSGPVFFAVFLGVLLSACAPRATQVPDINLARVHESGAHRIAFDPGSQRIASGGYRGEIKIWSIETGAELYAADHHKNRVTGLGWLDDRRLVSVDSSGLLMVNDIEAHRLAGSTQLAGTIDMAMAPDRSWLLVINDHGLEKISLPALESVAQYRLEGPLSVAVNHSGKRVAVSLGTDRVFLLNADLQPLSELERPSRKARDLTFSPDDRYLLAGGWFRLLVWQLDTGRLREHKTEHLGKINSVAISPDGARWVSLGRDTDSQFLLYDASTMQIDRRLQTQALCGQRARFSPDGHYVASSSDDGSVHIYDLTAPYRPVMPYLEDE